MGPAFGIGVSLSHYAKIGPTYNIKEIRENSIDRYVQEEGLLNLKKDAKNTYTRVCNAAGYCVWKASCMLSSKEAFKRGLKRIKEKACESGAYLTTQFLNGLSSCVKGNFKELVLSPYDILTKVGDE